MYRVSMRPTYLMHKLYREVDRRNTSYDKGKALEELMVLLFEQVPGFEVARNQRSKTEEIDLLITNESVDEFWRKQSLYFLVECKDLDKHASRRFLDEFNKKITSRKGQSKVGFFVSWNGFTSSFKDELLRYSNQDIVLILIDKKDIKEAISIGIVNDYLKVVFFLGTGKQ